MKRIHYLLLGLMVSLTIAAVSPTMPPTRIAAGSGVTVTTNGLNNFTIASSIASTNNALLNGTNTFTGTNTFSVAISAPAVKTSSTYLSLGGTSGGAGPEIWTRSGGVYAKVGVVGILGFEPTFTGITDVNIGRGAAGRLDITDNNGYLRDLVTRSVYATNLYATNIVIGGGSAIKAYRSATATLNFASILAAGYEDLTITVTGAAVNDTVTLGLPATVLAGAVFNAWVSAADTVTVRCNNAGAIAVDPASATYRVGVTSH